MAEKTEEYIWGDLNNDGKIDAADLTILARHIAKVELITDANMLKLADVNKDGKLSAADLTALTAYIQKNAA